MGVPPRPPVMTRAIAISRCLPRPPRRNAPTAENRARCNSSSCRFQGPDAVPVEFLSVRARSRPRETSEEQQAPRRFPSSAMNRGSPVVEARISLLHFYMFGYLGLPPPYSKNFVALVLYMALGVDSCMATWILVRLFWGDKRLCSLSAS